ncbi:MAG: hypothetical protein CM15mP84_02560 [Cellvibrionales bacterium]|nr:MAG: hypothetical protein CM15mP84_02560 [Cellvibrionales bacterium]
MPSKSVQKAFLWSAPLRTSLSQLRLGKTDHAFTVRCFNTRRTARLLLEQPTLVLNPHGNLREPTQAFAALIPNAELVELPDLKYGIFDTAPDVLAAESALFSTGPSPHSHRQTRICPEKTY